jgi:hypothetical protein
MEPNTQANGSTAEADAPQHLRTRGHPAKLAATAGVLMYVSYGWAASQWTNPWLVLAALIMSTFLPFYARGTNQIDNVLVASSSLVTAGRFGRYLAQLLFNLFLFTLLIEGTVISRESIAPLGGILGAAAFTTLVSQGGQYVAVLLASKGLGNRDANVLVSLCVTVVFTAFAMLGYAGVRDAFRIVSLTVGGLMFVAGLVQDFRGLRRRRVLVEQK